MPTPNEKPRRRMPTRTEQANAAAHAAAATRVAAYTRERRLLRAYTRGLTTLSLAGMEALIATCFGANLNSKRLDTAYERLEEDVPELIRHMRYEEQEALEQLLSQPSPDLVAVVQLVLKQERKLIQREPLQVLLNDEAQYRAAGLGRITSENYGRLRPGYLPDLLPEPKQLVLVALPKRVSRPRRTNPWVQGSLFGGFGAVGGYAQF